MCQQVDVGAVPSKPQLPLVLCEPLWDLTPVMGSPWPLPTPLPLL